MTESTHSRALSFREKLRQEARDSGLSPQEVSENFDIVAGAKIPTNAPLQARARAFWNFAEERSKRSDRPLGRFVCGPAGPRVLADFGVQGTTDALMFGSNNYLGFANHPYVKEKVIAAAKKWGVGAGGPPAINGYTTLLRETEERIAALKGTEDVVILSSGYAANVGLSMAIARSKDQILFDSLSHASFIDGLQLSSAQSRPFPHNDMGRLRELLMSPSRPQGDTFIAVEGVYSMAGDLAPLDQIVSLAKTYGAVTILDDAHGTGVLGRGGAGTSDHLGVHGEIDLVMGTFSKVFGVTGGFLGGSREVVRLLRFSHRGYVFSAAPAPTVLAAVQAGLHLLEREPERQRRLHENIAYCVSALRNRGFNLGGETPILALPVPQDMDIDVACVAFQRLGIFLAAIEFPAVPKSAQQFRISLMSEHSKQDLDQLLHAIDEVWSTCRSQEQR